MSVVGSLHKGSWFQRSKLAAASDGSVGSTVGSPRKLRLNRFVSSGEGDSLGGLK